ncbi:UNVERIFIED_CONTAM: Phosphoserine phosphatase, chloroplastic [Sesamum radiatum]|uniref:Phosphoserine phosphatase, chloroplastic n=1 Tax=Sesamum radiatum TaxID=300843 RepID=A0AAW2RX21_SESRA
MEGLISAKITLKPILSSSSRQQNSILVPALPPKVAKRVLISPTWMMRNPKSINSIAASFQPLEGSAATSFDNTLPSKEVLDVWRTADAVCFDVDSTVCVDEGIDELAEFCGAGKAVAEWTARAMSGSVPFEQALAARLSLLTRHCPRCRSSLRRDLQDSDINV